MSELTQGMLDASPSFKQLLVDVRQEITLRRARAEAAVEHEKLLMHHAIGRYIKTHLLENKDRADYGKALIKLLAEEVGMNKTDLYASVLFFELYPEIFHPGGKLHWGHIKLVLQVKNEVHRAQILKKIEEQNLTREDVKEIVSKYTATQKKNDNLDISKATLVPPATRGRPYTYRLVTVAGGIVD